MRLYTIVIFIISLILSGCSSEPKKEEPKEPTVTKINVSITASCHVNPDINGRSSPIALRLYELKTIGKFEEADFFKLFEDYEASLGSDHLASEKIHLKPCETQVLNHPVSSDTKYIALTAAFRDINQAVWRDFIAIEPDKTTELTVMIDNLNMTLKKKAPK
jgi:type VI secretion system protein VasD